MDIRSFFGGTSTNKQSALTKIRQKKEPSTPPSQKDKNKKSVVSKTSHVTKTKRKTAVSSSENDSDPENPMPARVLKKQKTAAKATKLSAVVEAPRRRKWIDDSSSDDEVLICPDDSASQQGTSKAKRNHKDVAVKSKPKQSSLVELEAKTRQIVATKQQERQLKPVTPFDFFGGAKVKPSKRTEHKKPKNKSPEVHDDASFEGMLHDMDKRTEKSASLASTDLVTPIEHSPVKSKSAAAIVKDTSSKQPSSADKRLIDKSVTPSKIDAFATGRIRSSPRLSANRRTSDEVSIQESASKSQNPFDDNRTPDPQISDEDDDEIIPSSQPINRSSKTKIVKKKPAPIQFSLNLESTSQSKASSTTVSPNKLTPKRNLKDTTGTPSTENGASSNKKGYYEFMHREPPKNVGGKIIPEGAENCLQNLTFVITGVLESIERADAEALVKKYGGKVTQSVSKRTSYMVAGRDAGKSKLAKATDLGTQVLDEDGLFELVRSLPAKTDGGGTPKILPKQSTRREPVSNSKRTREDMSRTAETTNAEPKATNSTTTDTAVSASTKHTTSSTLNGHDGSSWTEKYKPLNLKQVVGQQGDKSCMNKLLFWLKNWYSWHLAPNRPKQTRPSAWAKADNGSFFKAVLLSGPPGIGKTTTAELCCRELGLHYVALNASDTRSKKGLEEHVSQLVGSHSLVEFLKGKQTSTSTVKHSLIMDEVDGMSGNEDRAGMQELIQLIKFSKIPIICICNDRQSQKVRSLANHCFDLRFYKPRTEQLRSRMMTIAHQEGLKMPAQALDQIIEGANHDIRQIIQHLTLLAAGNRTLNFDEARKEAEGAKKDVAVNLFDAARRAIVAGDIGGRRMSLIDRSELFFTDYSMIPLFCQENYVRINPMGAKSDLEKLRAYADAAELISLGDSVERLLRNTQSWSLLNAQCMFSCVLPAERLNGNLSGQLTFPTWLGKNSTANKRQRQLQQLQAHMRLGISADLQSLQSDYVPALRDALTLPLLTKEMEGVKDVVSVYEAYDLTREDADSIFELSQWSGQNDPTANIPSKVKAAVTRTYNKEHHLLPYSNDSDIVKGVKGKPKRHNANSNLDVEMGTIFDEEGNPLMNTNNTADNDGDSSDTDNSNDVRRTNGKAPAAKNSTAKKTTKPTEPPTKKMKRSKK